MNNRNKERMTKTSGCEISDDDIGLRMSIRNSYSDSPPLIDASSSAFQTSTKEVLQKQQR